MSDKCRLPSLITRILNRMILGYGFAEYECGKVPLTITETEDSMSSTVFIRSSVIWDRVHDFQLGIKSYQQKINLTTPTISFPRVEKHKMFSIIYEPVHGIIYKNSKKEKKRSVLFSPSFHG
ncbi:hypothetical protein Tco_0726887 [Tanacetum coccineum]|uniref:Uncharacterized protein n=1 Tax=Tanacetum coccineum TaxID=301880 RepID=A0ABQ4YHX3_9ASTR